MVCAQWNGIHKFCMESTNIIPNELWNPHVESKCGFHVCATFNSGRLTAAV
jgi:hypothetical protein